MPPTPHETFPSTGGPEIAYRRLAGTPDRTGVVWLGGFKSTMDGGKAASIEAWARARDRACLRFDYSGHGLSGGAFRDGTISRWLAEARQAFETLTEGPRILVGSSMGGWIALLLARARLAEVGAGASRIAGLVLIAPAADMTERLIWGNAGPEIRRAIDEDGVWLSPSAYGDGPYPITKALIEDGRRHLIMGGPIATGCPVRILHGLEDPDVPWRHSLDLVDCLEGDDVTVTFVKGGDHRLSTDRDIARLGTVLEELATTIEA